jgi:predicted CXXCH cytochrome family protein
MNYPVQKARCTSCHDPHGSDRRGILYNTVHPPVAKALCAQCHEPAGSPTALRTKSPPPQLCRGCHSEKFTAIADKGRMHRPVADGSCLACHSPHAGKEKGLLKAGMVTVCGTCHADTIRRQNLSPTKHEPVADGKCTVCHDPHSSDGPLALASPQIVDLCGKCHDWLKHSSHPMGDKFADPRNPNLRLQCLSCHRSHGTEYKHLIPYATTTDLCTKCHEKFKR